MRRLLLFIIGLLCLSSIFTENISAQTPQTTNYNYQLLKEKQIDEFGHVHDHNIRFMRSRSKNVFIRYNPVTLLFGGMMYVYQGFISPQLPSECLYETSCSHYSQALILEYGLLKGVVTTSDRLMRCNRLSALDVHPLLIDEQKGKVIESVDIY